MPVDPIVIAAAFALLGVGLTAWLTWVASGAGRLQNRVDLLEGRVSKLEDEKQTLNTKLSLAASFINRIGLWIRNGNQGPVPQPPLQISEHLDVELWDDHTD